ncbi:MAG: PKD domain-containing protein [Bacteroidota bacterium]
MRFLLNIFFLFFCVSNAGASHIVGGDIYYDYLGNNNYRFYITLYRDCNSTGALYDNPLSLGVFTTSNGALVQSLSVPFPGSTVLPINFNNPCVVPPNNLCTERAIYVVTVNLPPVNGGYTVAYQRCCRGPNITNLNNPDDTGITLVATIPGPTNNFYINSSPRFTNYPPLLLCNNDDLIFDHSATDPDGDQLVYSLTTPFAGASGVNPAPVPPPGPGYFPVSWATNFGQANPLGPGATINIDPATGILTASPSMLGLFVVGVRVQEYRNGVLIGQTVRDFLFKVFNCQITMQAILPTQEQLPTFVSYCQGLTVDFVNNSYGGTNYSWDFGVPGISTDVSTSFAPSYTYPQPGIYTAMLVVNPGWPCTDTAYMTVNVNNEFNVSFTSNDSLCILGNSFDFVGTSDGLAGSTYEYDFGPNATPNNATTLNVNNVQFTATGNIPVTLTGDNGSCEASYTGSIYIYPEPIAGMVLPTNYECNGLTLNFGNNSQNTSEYAWDFGVAGTTTDESTAFSPSFTFPQGGTYTIQLIAGTSGECYDTVTQQITVYDPLSISFTNIDSLCVLDNLVDFDATATGPSITTYLWNFGPNASPSSATTLDVNDVNFTTHGTFPISVTASFNSCQVTATGSVFLFREPTVNFAVEPGPHCVPSYVSFTNLSQSDVPLQYLWNFGDGTTSTLANPTHLYSAVGSYSVSLQIIASYGCVDTLFMMKQDAVVIHPRPTSAFSVSPQSTDICHAEITFTDQSLGAVNLYYEYDDTSNFIENAPAIFIYEYATSGTHWPMQIAENEFGCTDTSFAKIDVEPFTIFIPNSFTPDGNEFNADFVPKFALEILDWELKIYNRWGQLVFVTTDPEESWDGSYKDGVGLVQEGTYAYVLKYISCEFPEDWQIETGHVNMIR